MTPDVVIHSFSGRSAAARAPEGLGPEERAALQQFSLDRLTAYGVHPADAVELRGRVAAGEGWQAVATGLAEDCLAPPEATVAPASPTTRANRLYRASALLRMSQMMMLADDDRRREIFARAADLYRQAAALTSDREPILVETEEGPLAAWLYPSRRGKPAASVVVIGGLEAWAMDFGDMGLELARPDIETLVVDGPGQGESRMNHRHYLTKSWVRSYQGVFDDLARRTGGAPLGVVGNSLGGAMALRLASQDARILACCDNGGPGAIGRPPANVSLPGKILAFCGDVTQEAAGEILQTLNPAAPDASVSCPLLIVHGALDHLVSTEAARSLFDWAKSRDKQMVIYSDGDHCVYNHSDDKHNLISDWISDRLTASNRK
ncbi:MAG: alpha/beta hydrolase family protein [Caulobacteraceae bacterium]